VMKLRETGHPAIERVGSERRSDIHPFVVVLRQDQLARGGVLGKFTRLCGRVRVAGGGPLCEHGGDDSAAGKERCTAQYFFKQRSSPVTLPGANCASRRAGGVTT